MITPLDVVYFIERYRRDKSFADWSREQIAHEVIECVADHSIVISFDKDNTISGVVTGTIVNPTTKLFRITNLLTRPGTKDALKLLFSRLSSFYPGWACSGNRHGREIVYSPAKISRLISTLPN